MKILVADDSRVYTCWCCGAPLHCEEPSADNPEPLECARERVKCGNCHSPIVLTEGYATAVVGGVCK